MVRGLNVIAHEGFHNRESEMNSHSKSKTRVKLEYPIERPDRIQVVVSDGGSVDELREDVVTQIREQFLPHRLRISRDIRSALVVRVCGTVCVEYRRVILEAIRALTGSYYREVQLA